jgi:hypothetical protein
VLKDTFGNKENSLNDYIEAIVKGDVKPIDVN